MDDAQRQEQDERGERSRELRRVQDQPDPIPSRRDQIQATRIELLMRGIPCAPLYELVDFVPGLSRDEQDLLEAQLLDAGLLDALVVPEEERPAIRDLLTEYPDRFLVPGPAVAQPIESLVPDGPEQFREAVSACLRGISRCDLEADAALLPDGQFRCGMVRGHSRAEAPAGFVGAAARRANRERQIRALEEQLAVLDGKIQAAQATVDAHRADLALLEAERAGMPTAEELDQALELLAQARRDMERAREEQERKQAATQAARQAWAAVEQECRALSAGLPYARTVPAYEEALVSAEDYQELLNDLESCRKDLSYAFQTAQELEQTIDQHRDDMDTLKRSNEAHLQALCVEQATQRPGHRRPPCAGQRDAVWKAVPSSVGLLLRQGLSIAASLDARYPGSLTPWHMAPEDYAQCRSGVRLSEASMALLPKCAGTPLEAAAKAVEHQGCAGYQELLLPWLEADLTQTP